MEPPAPCTTTPVLVPSGPHSTGTDAFRALFYIQQAAGLSSGPDSVRGDLGRKIKKKLYRYRYSTLSTGVPALLLLSICEGTFKGLLTLYIHVLATIHLEPRAHRPVTQVTLVNAVCGQNQKA